MSYYRIGMWWEKVMQPITKLGDAGSGTGMTLVGFSP